MNGLPSCIQHIQNAAPLAQGHFLIVGILDRGIMVFHKALMVQLDGQCTLAHTTCTHNHHLVLWQVLANSPGRCLSTVALLLGTCIS